jgi:hypothetical protein
MPPWQRPPPMHCFPLTDSTVLEFYEYLFAPWVKGLGIRGFLGRVLINAAANVRFQSEVDMIRQAITAVGQPS